MAKRYPCMICHTTGCIPWRQFTKENKCVTTKVACDKCFGLGTLSKKQFDKLMTGNSGGIEMSNLKAVELMDELNRNVICVGLYPS